MSIEKANIPVAQPDLSGNEEKYVLAALRSSWISSTGTFVSDFEEKFATICDSRAAISVCNGTVALHLALLTLDVRQGDEVIVPSLTYVATANAVRYVGGVPVFVDVDPGTWCLDPKRVEAAITPRTKGIIAVHLYGHPADMDQLNHVAAINGLWMVEDAAEAPLASYKGRPTGGLGTIGTFSFYGNKILTSGEGGAITISDKNLELRARTLRGQGMDPKRRYYFPVVGYNFRLTNIACAILCAQLERRDAIIRKRQNLYSLYGRLLHGTPGIGFQPVASWAIISPWLFSITVEPKQYGRSRDDLMSILTEAGIETRPFFIPLHQLPPYRDLAKGQGGSLAFSDQLSVSGMNLPTYTEMTSAQVERVAETIVKSAR